MKVVNKEKIGSYTVVSFISDAAVDPEATKEKIAPMITGKTAEEDVQRLFMENCVCFKVGPEAELVNDETAERLRQRLDEKGENRLLLDNGEYIDDYRGVEYWIMESGKWAREKIEEIGITLPPGAVLQENLSKEQQEEISAQNEEGRIASLTPGQRADEKRSRLHALAREAIMKVGEAELLDEEFDKILWLQPRKEEIERLYA